MSLQKKMILILGILDLEFIPCHMSHVISWLDLHVGCTSSLLAVVCHILDIFVLLLCIVCFVSDGAPRGGYVVQGRRVQNASRDTG